MSDDTGGFSAPPPPPPPPSGGGGGPLPQRGLGEILSTAFDMYKANAAKLITVVAIVVVPLIFVQELLYSAFRPDAAVRYSTDAAGNITSISVHTGTFFSSLLLGAVVALVGALIVQVLIGAVTRAAAGSLIGRPVDVGASYEYAMKHALGLLLVSFLVALATFFGFFLLIIGSVIFATFFCVSIVAFVIEGKRGTAAMSRSWELVRGSFWHTLGTIFVASIIAGLISGIISAIGGNAFITRWIFGSIAAVLVDPFIALVYVVLYLDLRARKEQYTAATLEAELDSAA